MNKAFLIIVFIMASLPLIAQSEYSNLFTQPQKPAFASLKAEVKLMKGLELEYGKDKIAIALTFGEENRGKLTFENYNRWFVSGYFYLFNNRRNLLRPHIGLGGGTVGKLIDFGRNDIVYGLAVTPGLEVRTKYVVAHYRLMYIIMDSKNDPLYQPNMAGSIGIGIPIFF